MDSKQVALVIAFNGYQPVEYSVPKNLLEQAGIVVATVSNKMGVAHSEEKESEPAVAAKVDTLLSDLNLSDYAGIFFIGGPNALENLDNETSYSIIREAFEKKMPLGAICVATRILAKAGVLKDKRATGWDGDNQLGALLKEHQAQYQPKDVVVDGLIITAVGPSAAREFGENIITMIQEYSNKD